MLWQFDLGQQRVGTVFNTGFLASWGPNILSPQPPTPFTYPLSLQMVPMCLWPPSDGWHPLGNRKMWDKTRDAETLYSG